MAGTVGNKALVNLVSINDILSKDTRLSGAKLISEHQGTANSCCHLQLPNEALALRIMGPQRLNATHRAIEFKIWNLAAQRGLAPQLRYYEPSLNYCVSQWIENNMEPNIARILTTVRRFHELPDDDVPRFNLVEALTEYCQTLEIEPHLLNSIVAPDIASLEKDKGGWCLCHNDLVPGNILSSRHGTYLIDFEYARINHRWFDLASISRQLKTSIEPKQLLGMYLQHPASNYDTIHFESADRLVLWLGFLWAKYEAPSWIESYRTPLLNYYSKDLIALDLLRSD